ncbi:MAG: imelysin family protein [Hyphomicrobiaceae bacterium]
MGAPARAATPTTTAATLTAADVITQYARMAEAAFEDSLAAGKALQTAVDAFLAAPSPATLEAARQAWVAARPSYLQTEAFRFTNPIVDAWEGKVNSWPLDEGLIDYVATPAEGSENPLANANVIAAKSIKINGETVDVTTIDGPLLRKLQEAGGIKANVATGYHAIEFLLWGQDLHGTGPGAGERPHSDYDLKSCTHANCDRRAAYLKAATQLLVEDLAWIAAQWKAEGEARKHITSLPPDDALVAIFSGLASLSYGELAGERTKLALLLHDPEEEHDCFSDNTHNSHYYDALGIENVYLGRFKRRDGSLIAGPSVSDLVKARSPATDDNVRQAIATTVSRMKAIVDKANAGMKFDMMIAEGNVEGNKLVQDGIDGLLAQTNALRSAVATLALKNLKVQDSDSLRDPASIKK